VGGLTLSELITELLTNKIAVELYGTFAEHGCFCDISQSSVLALSERIVSIVSDTIDKRKP